MFGYMILGMSHDSMHVNPGDGRHTETHEDTWDGLVDGFEDWWV